GRGEGHLGRFTAGQIAAVHAEGFDDEIVDGGVLVHEPDRHFLTGRNGDLVRLEDEAGPEFHHEDTVAAAVAAGILTTAAATARGQDQHEGREGCNEHHKLRGAQHTATSFPSPGLQACSGSRWTAACHGDYIRTCVPRHPGARRITSGADPIGNRAGQPDRERRPAGRNRRTARRRDPPRAGPPAVWKGDAAVGVRGMLYGSGYLGIALTTYIVSTWVTYAYAPPAGRGLEPLLPVGLVGIAVAIGRVVDAVADPLVGLWSDGARTRWGRRRPFIVAGAPLLALSFWLLWTAPPAWSDAVTFAYLAIVLSLFFFFFTVVVAPYLALLPEISRDRRQRLQLAGWQAAFNVIGVVIAGLAAGPLIEA